MEVVIVQDQVSGGALVGDAIQTLLDKRPTAVLGLATGSSVRPVYDDLIARYRAGALSFARARGCQLDEYVGLPAGHPSSYRAFIKREVTSQLDFAADAVIGPDGSADNLPEACARYEQALSGFGGVDLQLLGIGTDGHIGFNEPVSSLGSRTRLKTLTERTRRDNARFFGGDIDAVPRHVITQGIATILEARHLVLLAWGSGKARAVANCIEGPVSAMAPASAIQLHPHVSVIVDESAATELKLADYYRTTWASKPAWQGL
jgi:glucosamine-6-phosphate deaminase